MQTIFTSRVNKLLLIVLLCIGIGSGCGGKSDELLTADQDAQQLYESAAKALANGRFGEAIRFFQILESRYPFSVYSLQAQLDITYSYYRYGQMVEAIAESERFIRFNPTHPNVDYAYYIKGLASFNENRSLIDKWFPRNPADFERQDLLNAFNAFAELVQRFPNSRYAKDARQRMIYLRNKLAESEIRIARFYMSRKAWIAAINRANYVLQNLQQTPANEQALEILVQANQALQLPTAAYDAWRVLQLNYPDNPLVQEPLS